MDIGTFRGVITIVLIVAFIGLVFWAYSGRRRAEFEAAAQMPLEDEPLEDPENSRDGELLR